MKLLAKSRAKNKHATLALAFLHPILFSGLFFYEPMVFEPPAHLEEFLNSPDNEKTGGFVNILAPRGSAKTTYMGTIYPLWRLYFRECFEMMDMPTTNYIVIVSKSEKMAMDRVIDIKTKIEQTECLQYLIAKETWGQKSIVTSNRVKIIAKGRGGQIRGSLFGPHRPDLLISDDLDDPETVYNPDVREKDQRWFKTDYIRAGSLDGSSKFVNVDTVKHQSSIASLLREAPDWKNILHRAIVHPKDIYHPEHEDLWKQWEKIYTNLQIENEVRLQQADAFYNQNREMMTKDVEELWPDMITYLNVRQAVCNDGYFNVMRELQNNPYDRDLALFDMEAATKFNIVQEGFLRDDNVLVKWEEMTGASIFLDWAGGKDIAANCFAAVVGVVWVPVRGNSQSFLGNTHGYVFDAFVRRVGHHQQVSACFEMQKHIKSTIQSRNFKINAGTEGFVKDTWEAQKKVLMTEWDNQAEARSITDFDLRPITRQTN